MIEDISARKTAEEELRQHAELSEHQALHDALTGLPNRVLFHDRIQQALLTAEREGGRVAVMLMDLDRFKEINDTLGHASGDHVLKVVGERPPSASAPPTPSRGWAATSSAFSFRIRTSRARPCTCSRS